MSKISGIITQLETKDTLNIITLDCGGFELIMMSLELSKDITIGSHVIVSVKSTSLSIGKNFSGQLSISNQLQASVKSIELGEMLCSVCVVLEEIEVEVILTKKTLHTMDLVKGDRVDLFIKASEISIVEVIDG